MHETKPVRADSYYEKSGCRNSGEKRKKEKEKNKQARKRKEYIIKVIEADCCAAHVELACSRTKCDRAKAATARPLSRLSLEPRSRANSTEGSLARQASSATRRTRKPRHLVPGPLREMSPICKDPPANGNSPFLSPTEAAATYDGYTEAAGFAIKSPRAPVGRILTIPPWFLRWERSRERKRPRACARSPLHAGRATARSLRGSNARRIDTFFLASPSLATFGRPYKNATASALCAEQSLSTLTPADRMRLGGESERKPRNRDDVCIRRVRIKNGIREKTQWPP